MWDFFWSYDALGADLAFHHFSPLRFHSDYEKGAFFESLYHLRNVIEQLRAEAIRDAANNQ